MCHRLCRQGWLLGDQRRHLVAPGKLYSVERGGPSGPPFCIPPCNAAIPGSRGFGGEPIFSAMPRSRIRKSLPAPCEGGARVHADRAARSPDHHRVAGRDLDRRVPTQQNKAHDAGAKTHARSAQTAMETYLLGEEDLRRSDPGRPRGAAERAEGRHRPGGHDRHRQRVRGLGDVGVVRPRSPTRSTVCPRARSTAPARRRTPAAARPAASGSHGGHRRRARPARHVRCGLRELRQRPRLPPAAPRVDRQAALSLSRVRDHDPRSGQHPDRLVATAAGALPRLRDRASRCATRSSRW